MTQAEAQAATESLNPGREEYSYTVTGDNLPAPFVVGALGRKPGHGADWESAFEDYAVKNRASLKLAPVNAVGRNDPCPCGSGKKFKKCCLN